MRSSVAQKTISIPAICNVSLIVVLQPLTQAPDKKSVWLKVCQGVCQHNKT